MPRFVVDAGVRPPHRAEYVAITQLQGDALVTLDEELARAVDGVVRLATIGDLT